MHILATVFLRVFTYLYFWPNLEN